MRPTHETAPENDENEADAYAPAGDSEDSEWDEIDPDDPRWDAFVADDDERNPEPEYGDFWPED
jgi:hypothetical protein